MLTTFLPIAIRAINPLFLKMAITRLCYFFNRISQKVIDRDELASLQEFAVETITRHLLYKGARAGPKISLSLWRQSFTLPAVRLPKFRPGDLLRRAPPSSTPSSPRRRYVPLSLFPFFDFDRSGTPPPPCTRRRRACKP
jgi:hypothetical protein